MSNDDSAPPAYHPDLAARARWLPRGVGRRWAVALLRPLLRVGAALVGRGEEVALDGCSLYVHRPATTTGPRPALLWIHGGGLLFGDARQDDEFLGRVVAGLGVTVASAQYRCAPAHPFPTPLDDCEKAFRWLVSQPDVDPSNVMVGGASAGGGLAAALCQRLRDGGGPQPSFQLLVYPMIDDRSAEGSGPLDPFLRMWDRRSNALGWSSYLRGHDRAAPPRYAVPSRCDDLRGLPPAWIGVGTLDLFYDEDRAYAERLRAAGVAVELDVIDGAYHGFDNVERAAPVSRRFQDAQLAALAGHLAGG